MKHKIFALFLVLITFSSFSLAENEKTIVQLHTNLGVIELELFPEQAPLTVKNFLQYVDEGFYEGTIFHRTIAGFMIQGGGYTEALTLKQPKSPIKNESGNGLSNMKGTIAMARTRHPHSATSQFFINTVNNRNLDGRGTQFGYTVFGRVTEGMNLVMQISRTPTAPQGQHRDVPKQAVVIQKIERVKTASTASTAADG
jgi:cyclophilin family peptidyl-prolyl cis-trans isomerase